jgi:hypothetical protein
MGRSEEEYGRPNPGAPPELSRFAFLIGKWRCDARLKRESGSWERLQASWVGRYVLDGYTIMDEFRMTKPTGDLLVLGPSPASSRSPWAGTLLRGPRIWISPRAVSRGGVRDPTMAWRGRNSW